MDAARRELLLGGGQWQTTKGALRSQTQAYGASGLPGNSAITATHTAGVKNASATLTGTLVSFTDSRFRYTGGTVQQAGVSFPDTQFYRWRCVTYDPSSNGSTAFNGTAEVSFAITGQQFEFKTKGLGSAAKYRILINGLYDVAGVQNLLASDGGVYYIKVDLGSAATRTITIQGNYGFYFGGVVQNTGETLSAASYRSALRLIGLSDSFGEGTGASIPQNGLLYTVGAMLGCTDIWPSGSGGTGWVQINGTRVALPSRINLDGVQQQPDIALVAMGYNDINDGNDAAVASGAMASIRAVRSGRPSSLIYVAGPWDVSAPSAPQTGYAAIKSACQNAALSVPGCKFIDMQGVTYTKIGDATHPDDAGHVTLGTSIGNAIKADLGL